MKKVFGLFLWYFAQITLSLRQNKKRMKYPLGIQSFEKIRNDGYLYMDKTAMVYNIVKGGTYYFLSRPRRFGKSLLISTLEAYFKGKKELFKGLAIEQLEQEWNEYPVLHLDLNARDYKDEAALDAELNKHLEYWEKEYGEEFKDRAPEERFQHVIDGALAKTGRRVVILVDEYDKPLLRTLQDPKLQTVFRSKLKAFFTVVKTMDAKIEFAFFTGVTKFSKVSVFSDLNNLTDITMDKRYSEICGITEAEIHRDLDDQVELLANENGMTKDACYEKLRTCYDGYRFCIGSVGIYNPYSLLRTFDSQTFGDYWFETGTPTILAEVLRKNEYNLEDLTHIEVTADLLGSLDSIDTNPLPIVYQSGYLTLRGYDKEFEMYRLGFPNLEVERGFTRFLIPYYTKLKSDQGQLFVANFVKELRGGKVEAFMKRLESLFADGDYQVMGDAELYFQNVVWVIFKMIGFYTELERHTSDGRIDMIVKTSDYIYIIEFKLDKTADETLQQIDDKQYAKPFEHDGRHIYKIGTNFSTKTRRIDGWKIAE